MKPVSVPGLYKRGSTWRLALRRTGPSGAPIDLSGVTQARAMFRAGTDAPVIVTLTGSVGEGIALSPADGLISLTLTPAKTTLFAPGSRILFDVELTWTADEIWQSPTYALIVDEEVTRDAD